MSDIVKYFTDSFTLPLSNPILIISLMLLIILLAPIILRKFHIPGIIVLILSGIIIGPYGCGLLADNTPIELFSTIGLLYIMFLAGLDLDMNNFKSMKGKSIVFGFFTFMLPLAIGFPVCHYILKFDFWASLLTASMFSTHTLVAYPIVSKFGIAKNQAVAVTVGGTIITDTMVLLLLAMIINSHKGVLNTAFFIKMLLSLLVFSLVMFVVVPRIAKWFFQKLESEKESHFIFVLAVMLFSAFLAEVTGLEPIIGAFVAGLALNKLIPHSSTLMNRIEFIGNALFIPFFLISVGMMLDLSVLFKGYMPILIAIVLSISAFSGKWLAAWITQHIFRYSKYQRHLIFGLSSAHAAATLAIILSGYKAGIVNEDILNGTILLILITCIVASLVTEKAARNIAISDIDIDTNNLHSKNVDKYLIPIAKTSNMAGLLEFVTLIRGGNKTSSVSVLSVVPDDEQAELNILKAKNELEKCVTIGSSAEMKVNVLATIDQNVAGGISRIMREIMADTLIIGWPGKVSSLIDKVMGGMIVSMLNNVEKNIFICSLDKPITLTRRIFLITTPSAELEHGFEQWFVKVLKLADELSVAIVHIGNENTKFYINKLLKKKRIRTKIQSLNLSGWDEFLQKMRPVPNQDLLILVSSREGFPSYQRRFEQAMDVLTREYKDFNKIAIYPQQLREESAGMFAETSE